MEEVTLLRRISGGGLGVRGLIEATRWKPTKVVNVLRKLEQEGLVEFELGPHGGRGRPKKIVRLTPLGQKFLKAFRECERLRLRTNRNDVCRAVRQTREVERLIAAGLSPYQILWELDEIVRSIRNSAEIA